MTPTLDLADRQAAGLRALANLIEANPDLADGFEETLNYSGIFVHVGENKAVGLARFARAAKASGHKVDKKISDQMYNLVLDVAGIKVKVLAYRSEICERVVTGTETVTKRVPDPVKLAEVPEVEVTETVETVEWVCRPILAATEDGAA